METTTNQSTSAFEEAPGQVSATRVIVIPSSLLVIATACFEVVWCTVQGKPSLPDIPIGTSAFMLSILGTLLGAKVLQKKQEGAS